MPYLRHEKAFTLIEILIALAILAILSTLIYGTFAQSRLLATRMEATSEAYQTVRQIFQVMQDELSMAYYVEPTGADLTSNVVFIAKSPDLKGQLSTDQPLLRFTTLGHRRWQPDSPETDLSLVEYEIKKDPTTNLLTLYHREETNLLSTTETSTEEYELAEGLKEFSLRFFDGADWGDSWDSTEKKDVPQAVEVKFVVPIENEDRTFSFVARIQTAKPFVTGVIKPGIFGSGNVAPP
jgi:general secretion pathway protein J